MVTYHYYNTKLGASFAIKVDYLMYWRIYVRVWIIIIFNERTTIVCISNKFFICLSAHRIDIFASR